MRKKLRHLKKAIVISAVASILTFPMLVSALGVTTSISTTNAGLTVGCSVVGTDCIAVTAIIDGKDGSTLASGMNGPYSANGYHTKSVSYTGLKWADRGMGIAESKAKEVKTDTKYWK